MRSNLVKFKIDLTNPDHIVAAAAFFNSLAGVVPGEVSMLKPKEKKPLLSSKEDLEKGRQRDKTTAKAAKAATQGAAKNQEILDSVAKDGEKTRETLEDGEATLEILQDLVPKLSKESKENIPKMRDKLIELGAKRVSSLTSDKYQEFYDFLKTLDNAGA